MQTMLALDVQLQGLQSVDQRVDARKVLVGLFLLGDKRCSALRIALSCRAVWRRYLEWSNGCHALTLGAACLVRQRTLQKNAVGGCR